MTAPFTLGLVINTCNQANCLSRVLAAVARQAEPAEEVLLADDGSTDQTRQVVADWKRSQTLPVTHLWQAHEGFRRSRILNEAIAAARSDYLVFLDGDTVPHPRFLADHRAMATPGYFVQGHRALIEQKASPWFGLGGFAADRRRALFQGQMRGLKHSFRWPFPQRRVRGDVRGVRGCNLAIWRADLVMVNGYNEGFVGWGREDSELAVRLMNSQVKRLDVRGRALCYHLWHPPADRANLPTNDGLLEKAIASGARRCEQGLSAHLAATTR